MERLKSIVFPLLIIFVVVTLVGFATYVQALCQHVF